MNEEVEKIRKKINEKLDGVGVTKLITNEKVRELEIKNNYYKGYLEGIELTKDKLLEIRTYVNTLEVK